MSQSLRAGAAIGATTLTPRERRRRLKRPRALVLFGVMFMLMPVMNYVGAAYQLGLGLDETRRILWAFMRPQQHYVALVLLLAPPVVGAGILSVRKWGWYSFLAYAGGLVLYNALVIARSPGAYNLAASAQTIFGLGMAGYFLQRDIFAPYMDEGHRGWRGQRRIPLRLPVQVNGSAFETRDVSASGCSVGWRGCTLALGAEVDLTFCVGAREFRLKGGVARIDPQGIGIAFRNLEPALRKELASALRSAPKPA